MGDPGDPRLCWQVAPADATIYARSLYAWLRELDGLAVDVMLIETPPSSPAWTAIADRLGRAAVGSGAEDDET